MSDLNYDLFKMHSSDLEKMQQTTSQKSEEVVLENIREVEEFPRIEDVKHGELLSLKLSARTSRLTHGFHRFPAKYIPQVPKWALKNFTTPNSVVLDPFMGSGTTLVEALRSVNNAFGTDIDPLACLLSKAKTNGVSSERLRELASFLTPDKLPEVVVPFLPMTGVKNVTHWFTEGAWKDLCRIYVAIEKLDCSCDERDFFLAVFSSILRLVSNADNQTQKTYVSGTLKKYPPDVLTTFEKYLLKAIKGVTELSLVRGKRKAHILAGSATSLPLDNNSVDLIVTSPPYLDSVDYMYNFMLEYFWLGPSLGVPSRAEYNLRRRMPIGSKNPISPATSIDSSILELFDPEQIPEYRRKAVLSYFSMMQSHFFEAARVMKEEGRYVLVVGNSEAAKGILPVHDCLLRLAKMAGLHLEKAFAYRIRRHYMKFPRKGRGGIILMDWVITLRKTKHAILDNEDRLPLPHVTIGADEVAN